MMMSWRQFPELAPILHTMQFSEVTSVFVPPALRSGFRLGYSPGLFTQGSHRAMPLKLRAVQGLIYADTSIADVTEVFAFLPEEAVSVVFKFPLPPSSVVYKLEAEVGDKTVSTKVVARADAQQTFNTAVSHGHTAVLAKQEEQAQIYTLELGNLPALQEAIIRVKYLRILPGTIDGAFEFLHTATWTPPYLGSIHDQKRGEAAAYKQNPRFTTKPCYELSYDLLFISQHGIRTVECSHAVSIKDEGGHSPEGLPLRKRVMLNEQVADPSRDLTVLVELPSTPSTADTPMGTARVSIQQCTRPGPTPFSAPINKVTALATFIPAPLPIDGPSSSAMSCTELWLVMDCSFSMNGSRISMAREAALFFIKDLPASPSLLFNMVVFGTEHQLWSPCGCQYVNPSTVAHATEWIQNTVHANLGGTEVLSCLDAVYAAPLAPGFTRTIIFLTDGGISAAEEKLVFELVGRTRATASTDSYNLAVQRMKDKIAGRLVTAPPEPPPRSTKPTVLCLGIGDGVHRTLLDGMARITGGMAHYVVDGESIARKTGYLLKAALARSDALKGAKVVCSEGLQAHAVPHCMPPLIFPGEPVHVLVDIHNPHVSGFIELRGTRCDGSHFSLQIPLDDRVDPPDQSDMFSVLHGMQTVKSLLDGTSSLHLAPDGSRCAGGGPSPAEVKTAIIQVATQEQILTPFTAAVGVMKQADPANPALVKQVEVPLVLPHGMSHFMGGASGGWQAQQDWGSRPPAAPWFFTPGPTTHQPVLFGSDAPAAPSATFGSGAPAATSVPFGFSFGSSSPPALFGSAPQPAFGSATFGSAAPAAGFGAATQPAFGSIAFGGTSTPSFAFSPATPAAVGSAPSAQAAPVFAFSPAGTPLNATQSAVDTGLSTPVAAHGSPGTDDGFVLVQSQQPGQDFVHVAPEVGAPTMPAVEVMSLLNVKRHVDGWWTESEELLVALTSQITDMHARQGAVAALLTARPAPLTRDQWVTVLALAFLRKHVQSEHDTWRALEAKALTWLTAGWPQGARPVGFTVLDAGKLV